ncbi:hypothetical protein B0T24DRAFT_636721 [Lasiosphaeria ovina]|uniref:Uncharacterized protein n=1 Tax=Lasiosphaeria ovina TaxID=92902 RepID=A0AAE0JWL5_9PEZI|nr:hypothetical protein B0T24DRAFT_636721 [Lasiosphaeria ovina]
MAHATRFPALRMLNPAPMMSKMVKGQTASCSSGVVVLSDGGWLPAPVSASRPPITVSARCLKASGSVGRLAGGYIKQHCRLVSITLPHFGARFSGHFKEPGTKAVADMKKGWGLSHLTSFVVLGRSLGVWNLSNLARPITRTTKPLLLAG